LLEEEHDPPSQIAIAVAPELELALAFDFVAAREKGCATATGFEAERPLSTTGADPTAGLKGT
jgi:hypothetical protein